MFFRTDFIVYQPRQKHKYFIVVIFTTLILMFPPLFCCYFYNIYDFSTVFSLYSAKCCKFDIVVRFTTHARPLPNDRGQKLSFDSIRCRDHQDLRARRESCQRCRLLRLRPRRPRRRPLRQSQRHHRPLEPVGLSGRDNRLPHRC